MGELSIGTCSWKYPSWEGLVYSRREAINYLAEYAHKYTTAEVDQWFWSLGKGGAALPLRETVAEYDASTPPGFRFMVKCPNAITLTHHHGRKGDPLQPNPLFLDTGFFREFLDILSPLVPKIGLFIFQFEYLNKDKMPSRQAFMDQLGRFLDGLPADMPYAVEIRNPRWMDDVAKAIERYGDRFGGTVCIRLHGEDREGMEERTGFDWSRIIRPKDEELERIVGSVKWIIANGRKVFINVNNHYEGSAPRTIEKIQGLFAS